MKPVQVKTKPSSEINFSLGNGQYSITAALLIKNETQGFKGDEWPVKLTGFFPHRN